MKDQKPSDNQESVQYDLNGRKEFNAVSSLFKLDDIMIDYQIDFDHHDVRFGLAITLASFVQNRRHVSRKQLLRLFL